MTYKQVQPYTKEEAEVAFAQGTSEQIRDALLGVTYYVEDWRWVQSACLAALDSSDSLVQEIAILCLGHLATFHKTLDLAIVLPALQAYASQPELASALNRALDDVASGVEDTSYFEEKWDELPQRIKERFIEAGFFNKSGQRIRKRNFISKRKDEMRGQISRDQELVEQLKRHCTASSSHNWQEYYDEQGRLLRLSLEGLGLVQPPTELWQFTSLLELDLSENQLSSLPAELGQLVNLESLNLRENEFSRLPAGLGQLINLQELYLGANHLNSLSDELYQLVNLQTLDLSENQLSSLPGELGQLINLLKLFLDENQFSSLPAELGQLVNLRTLFLCTNQLSSLPAELGQLVNLQWLRLDENQLSSLPAELGQLVNLYWLVLRQNQLSSLPAELGQLVHLQELDLSQNPQLQIPPPEVVQEGISAVLAYLRALL